MATIRQDKDTKVFLVTGATGAIGKAIARQLAALGRSEVVLVCRDKLKAELAVTEIIAATGNPDVRFEITDLSRHKDIRELAGRWVGAFTCLGQQHRLHPPQPTGNPGRHRNAVRHQCTGLLLVNCRIYRKIKSISPARVVNVASYWAGGLDLTDLEFKRRNYDNGKAYRQSKQANRMLSAALAERLKPFQITVNACHPGDVNSVLSNNLGFGGHETPDQGAKTPVWLATHPIGQEVTGRHFEHLAEINCPFVRDKKAMDELFDICSNYATKPKINYYQ